MCYELFSEKSPKQKMSITQEPIIGSSWNLVCGNIFRVYYYGLLWQKALKPIFTGICISGHFLQNRTLNSSRSFGISFRFSWSCFKKTGVRQASWWIPSQVRADEKPGAIVSQDKVIKHHYCICICLLAVSRTSKFPDVWIKSGQI